MAETALNFGPDWIRALATGSSSTPSTSTPMPIPRYSLAEFRYGREEMLALIPKDMKVPPGLQQYPHLKRDKFQIPLALTPVTEEEQLLMTRCVNSDVALRAKSGQGYGMNRTGRGGSVDRGRGRGRGGYYQRGMMHDDSEDGGLGFSRPKVERSLSANEKDHRWDDRDRRYDRTFAGRGGLEEGNMKHDNTRGPTEYWRKFDKDDDGDWRTSGYRSSDKTGGRGSWRSGSDRDRRDMVDRNLQNRLSGGSKSSSGPQGKLGNHSSWKDENQASLPEWSIEESSEPDTVGTFDSSGAFLETKVTANKSFEDVYASDDADEGNKDSPEALKESSKKTPKKSPGVDNSKKATSKQNSKSSSENPNIDEKPQRQTVSEPQKGNSKNSPSSSAPKLPAESAMARSSVAEDPPASVKNRPDVRSDLLPQPNVPRDVTNSPAKARGGLMTSARNSESAAAAAPGVPEEDTFAHHQKATENMVAQWTEEIEEQRVPSHAESIHPPHEKETKWFYQDPQGEIQGPFASAEMLEWFSAGYFTMGLMVRRSCDEKFSQLGDLIKAWDRVPFMPGSSPPPIRVTPLTSTLASPITQTIVPNPVAAAPAPLPKQEDQLLALQQQLFQQQLMQQQLMLRQAQLQLLAQLKQQENFTSLNSQQQEQVLMQQFLAQQQQLLRSNLKPMPESGGILDSLGPVPPPLLGLSLPAVMKNDLSMWQTPPGTGVWPMNPGESKPPGGSIWDVDINKQNNDESPADKQQKLVEEHEKLRRVEEMRLEHEREMEEQRKKEELRRKQEELRIHQEMQKEEERKRLEELQRVREEEQKRQEELKRLEEQRRREEEEERKKAELMRLEELRKQEELKKQEEVRKQEEIKRLEDLKRKEEQRRLEELKKQQELRKEEKRKKEELKRLQMEKEQQRQLELERQKEALRQKEVEREERLVREKREREEMELRRLAELKLKSQGPVWGIQKSQSDDSELSLADIQKIQEEKEKEEREEKLRKQQMQQQVEKQLQQSRNGITWAKRANEAHPVVKSLAEIQQEEAERLAQASRMQKPPPPAPIVNTNAGVWGNSSHLNKITAASGWNNTNNVSASGFWEDVPSHNTQPKKPPQKTNSDTSAFPALSNHPVQPAAASSNKSKNVRAKKDEDAVARLFGSHHKPTDEFTKWCTDAISAMPSSVDVPTFVAFLKDIESPYEVFDYVKSYFGEGKEPREFAKQFLEKRSKFRNQAKQAPAEDNSLWGPAPAITPVVNKMSQPSSNDCDGNSSSRGKSKKKKNRMQKLDSSLLGFTVQPNPDRINVGEIDHVENV